MSVWVTQCTQTHLWSQSGLTCLRWCPLFHRDLVLVWSYKAEIFIVCAFWVIRDRVRSVTTVSWSWFIWGHITEVLHNVTWFHWLLLLWFDCSCGLTGFKRSHVLTCLCRSSQNNLEKKSLCSTKKTGTQLCSTTQHSNDYIIVIKEKRKKTLPSVLRFFSLTPDLLFNFSGCVLLRKARRDCFDAPATTQTRSCLDCWEGAEWCQTGLVSVKMWW